MYQAFYFGMPPVHSDHDNRDTYMWRIIINTLHPLSAIHIQYNTSSYYYIANVLKSGKEVKTDKCLSLLNPGILHILYVYILYANLSVLTVRYI